jgi:putative spermidine/putrescine transport system ATP-binding protein
VAAAPTLPAGTQVMISVRPERLRVASVRAEGALAGVVKAAMPLGPQVVYEIELAGGTLLKVSEARETAGGLRQPGQQVHLTPASPASCHVFPVP